MTSLDQQIKDAIDGIIRHPTSTHETLRLADALRNVLYLCDDDDAPPLAAFLAQGIRLGIASALGITEGDVTRPEGNCELDLHLWSHHDRV